MADFNEYKGVWVFCEQRQGALMSTDFELVSEARKLADELGCEVTGLLLGDNVEGIAKELGGYGADKVMVCDSPLLKDYTPMHTLRSCATWSTSTSPKSC